MLNEIIEEENILDEEVNNYFIKRLCLQGSWFINSDFLSNKKFDSSIPEEYSDTGMILKSYGIDSNEYMNNHNSIANEYANLIFTLIMSRLENKMIFFNVTLKRYLWNYYNRSSYGFYHSDTNLINHCSIVYYLNTCDGYTEIKTEKENKKIFSESGKSIIFNSNLMHRGIGPKKYKNRMVLNILFEYEKVELK